MEFLECSDTGHTSCRCKIKSPADFKQYVEEFVHYLRQIHPKKNDCVTPYIHAWAWHIPPMLEEYKTLRPYSTSAQELLNSLQTLTQFRASNQHDIPYDLELHQLVSLWFSAHPDIQVPFHRTNLKKFDVPID